MKGRGRFGSDAKQRLAARQVSLKREKNKDSRERAFSSPPSRTINDVANPISVEGASSIAGAYASRGLQKGIKSNIGQGLLGPIVGRIANYLIPENNKPIKDMTTQERKAEAYNALELPPIVGDAASIARVMEDINREGLSPRTLARGGVDIGLSILNPVGGAAPIKNVTQGIISDLTAKLSKKETDELLLQLEKAVEMGDDETADDIARILREATPTRPVRETVEEVDKVKGAVRYADAIVKNPQPDVIVTAPDRTAFDALRWRVESGSEQEFASVVGDAALKAPNTPVSYVLRRYGVDEKRTQVDRFWARSANKALGSAEEALSKAGVDVDILRKNGRNYSDEDIASMHSVSRNTGYQVWERVEGSPIFWDKKKRIARAKGGGKVEWDASAEVFRISKEDGSVIEYSPKNNDGYYYVHRGDHIDHLIPKDLIGKRVEDLVDAGDIETAAKYYTFMNNPANFFALHGGVNSSKTNALIKKVKELAPKSDSAKRNSAIFNAQSDEYQAQLDNAWSQLSELVGVEEADLFYNAYKK